MTASSKGAVHVETRNAAMTNPLTENKAKRLSVPKQHILKGIVESGDVSSLLKEICKKDEKKSASLKREAAIEKLRREKVKDVLFLLN